MTPKAIQSWHQVVASQDADHLDALLADEVVFYSPVVHTPQRGKGITTQYLTAAFAVLFNDTFRYTREVIGDQAAMLEFLVEIDGISVNGVDIIAWNDAGQIVEFKVMIRPLKGIQIVHQKMAEGLTSMR